MDARERVAELLTRCGRTDAVLPATALFNEGWMLRLVLDWASRHPSAIPELTFEASSRWYSEALLPSRFRPRRRGDTAGEGFTHADGVIGHFRLRPGGRGDIELLPGAGQLVVVEAKMASGLSAGTTRAPDFNQAARNVACIVQLVSISGIDPAAFTRLGFVLLAPAERIADGIFAAATDKDAICAAVSRRAEAFDREAVEWCRRFFDRVAPRCSVSVLSWEEVLSHIAAVEPLTSERLWEFYRECLRFNAFQAATGLRSNGSRNDR